MRIIILQIKKSGKLIGFSSLESFLEDFENYRDKKDTIVYYLTRKKTFFEDSEIKLQRIRIKGRKAKSKNVNNRT